MVHIVVNNIKSYNYHIITKKLDIQFLCQPSWVSSTLFRLPPVMMFVSPISRQSFEILACLGGSGKWGSSGDTSLCSLQYGGTYLIVFSEWTPWCHHVIGCILRYHKQSSNDRDNVLLGLRRWGFHLILLASGSCSLIYINICILNAFKGV